MSLWRDRSRLQELLGGVPRAVLGGLEVGEDEDERSLVIIVEEAVEAVEEAEHDETLAIVLGSLAALVVAGSVVYIGLSRYFPTQTRRFEAAALGAATTVVQVKLIRKFLLWILNFFCIHL